MPPFLSPSTAAGFRKNGIRHVIRAAKNIGDAREHGWTRIRCLGSVARSIRYPSTCCISVDASNGHVFASQNLYNVMQRRRFLGCGDGEEGSVLSRVYEEKRVLGYSPEQLFDVVAAVDLYEGFVPWCKRSEIIRRHPDGSFDAELEIGFKFLVESYISHVELRRPNFVKTTVSQSSLFDHLINAWDFKPGTTPGTCNLYFMVDFKFQSPFYRQIASVFFKEVVSRLVGSFTDRCRLIYGPGVAILENPYEQGL